MFRRVGGDPLAAWDPWNSSDRPPAIGEAQRPPPRPATQAWLGYNGSAEGRKPEISSQPGPSPVARNATFFEGTKEEFMQLHVCYRVQDQVRNLSDAQLFQLGQRRFGEQPAYLMSIERGDVVVPEPVGAVFRPRSGSNGEPINIVRPPRPPRPEVVEDEYDDPPFWWRFQKDLFFDLPITQEEDLTSGAPPVYQWWDVSKVAESENFVAVSKPAGMFVVTDQRGLWDPSPTNLIHVAHKRFDIGSAQEPCQRGICHRLDSHTSGLQIFGRSIEAFEHFTRMNTTHRVQKEYLALVEGRLGDDEMPGTGIIDVPMKKWQDYDRREFGSVVCAHEGLPAVTKYRALRQWQVPATGSMQFWGKDRWFTLVQVRILSGRTHQIRVHLAAIGHPLAGDNKYNSAHYEWDAAVVPRIFLHCFRMEFEEFDGSVFVATADLAPDLQAALKRIERLSVAREAPAASSLPGLQQILQDSADCAVKYPPAQEGAAEAFKPRVLLHKCRNCRQGEQMICSMIQRKDQIAMSWKLVTHEDEGDGNGTELPVARTADQLAAAGEPSWGPGLLWVPSTLQHVGPPPEVEVPKGETASMEELGEGWGSFGAEWCWAHNGTKENGWIRLCSGGRLESKWGAGTWASMARAEAAETPLLLVTFNAIEHALRLMHTRTSDASECPGRFDVVSIRRLGDGQKSLAEDLCGSEALKSDAPAICTTQGWPKVEV